MSTGRQIHANAVNTAGVLPPPSTLKVESKQLAVDPTSAIGVYRKYYTDVLGYFKTLLDNLENVNSSTNNRPQITVPNNVQNCRPLDNDPWSHSKTIMEGYFRRSGARDWDWASWHNYLSWISRTHPEWFQLFSECSKQMGIDWDVMYQKWLASKSNVTEQAPVFDLSRPPPASTSNPQQAPPPPIANPFCLTSVPPPQDPRVWCEDCDKYFPTQRAYDIHLRGVCHIQNALTKTITYNASAVLDIPPPQWAPQVHPPHIELAAPRNKPVADLRPSQKRQLRIQHLLDICIQPLVGLNYVTEFQRRGLLECIYICDLCEKRAFLPSAVIKHVCSIRHRMAYLKYHYPPLHQLVSLDRSPESIRKRRLTSYAQQVESNEGRKRLSIMVEKENSTFKTRIEPLEPEELRDFPLASEQNVKALETLSTTKITDVVSASTTQPREPEDNNNNGLGDDEIEEGEMLDCSTSSSSCTPEDQEGLARKGGIISPASSHFSDEDDGNGDYDNSKLPSFFSTGVVESGINRQSSIFVHLPDFETGFVSERPLLPDFTVDEYTHSHFIERLKKTGLLGSRSLSTSETSEQQDGTPVEVVLTDSQLVRSFEEEVQWALQQLETAAQKANPLQFSFKPRSKIATSSAPLLPDPPAVLLSTSKVAKVENGETGKISGPSMEQNNSRNPESVKRAVKTLLGDFEPSPLQPLPGSRHGQTIPVIMSNQPRPLLPQPSHPASVPDQDNPKVSELGDPPKRLKLDQLDGVKSLLSSPLDALQALLKGNLGVSAENQQREEKEVSGSSAPITQPPTTPSPCPTEIFDGYSYFSRQEEEETKTQERVSAAKSPLISHRQRQSITRSAATNTATTQGRSSKLATFADMLGMNEPPAPPPPSRQPPPPTIPVQPTVPQVSTNATSGILSTGLAPGAWLATSSLWQPPAVIPAQTLAPHSSSTAAAAAFAAATGGFNPAAFVMPANVFGPILRPPMWRP
ncbi:unnamed protein product [Hydatigera taeniaeformis]|uniref:C2H2-type domain-containing protein n=1 Tax=Hydatigena taeniaeformis TaxID=6205 RepID=A0A0R3WLS1_HYDTA|nr:unnamed protein product [Hydatigera taeniaeformis]